MPKFKEWKHAEIFVAWAQRQVEAGKIDAFDRDAVMESEIKGADGVSTDRTNDLCVWSYSCCAGDLMYNCDCVFMNALRPVPSYAMEETGIPNAIGKVAIDSIFAGARVAVIDALSYSSGQPRRVTISDFKASPEQSKSTSHDAHYRKLEARGVEPIAVMEAIICAGLPEEYHKTAKRNLNLAMEAKYNLRLGEKDAQEKELDKGDNYRYRARNGKWPWEAK